MTRVTLALTIREVVSIHRTVHSIAVGVVFGGSMTFQYTVCLGVVRTENAKLVRLEAVRTISALRLCYCCYPSEEVRLGSTNSNLTRHGVAWNIHSVKLFG